MTRPFLDVLVIGGGPAGCSAALVLGRCRRRVLVVDDGRPRNAAARCLHGYLTRDGIPPDDFREAARRELHRYGVVWWDGEVVEVAGRDGAFAIRLADGRTAGGRKVLLAPGVRDELPPLPRLAEFFGVSIHVCPYCDGWERRDQPLAVWARGRRALHMARALTCWTSDLIVLTEGPSGLGRRTLGQLAAHGIAVFEEPVVDLEGEEGQLRAIRLADGRRIERTAIFLDTPVRVRSELAVQLGCTLDARGAIRCHGHEATDVAGVYAAGNALGDVQLVVMAAAEGAKAAFGINVALTREDFEARVGARAVRSGQ